MSALKSWQALADLALSSLSHADLDCLVHELRQTTDLPRAPASADAFVALWFRQPILKNKATKAKPFAIDVKSEG